ncbi:MAG: hypothetical protein GXO04_06005 [Aquificae bacterium]|nr:hypothetical protein [Aquificota bacterium]
MKIDLTERLRDEPPFRTHQEAKEHVARYLLSFINIELEGLPRSEWERAIGTWKRMCLLAHALSKKPEEARRAFYKKNKFDLMMEGIMEELIRTLTGFYALGILKEDEEPSLLLRRATELVEKDGELIRKFALSPEVLSFVKRA